MATFLGHGHAHDLIDSTITKWKQTSLTDDRSLLFSDTDLRPWSEGTVAELNQRFNGNPLEGEAGGGSFSSKWAEQLESASTGCRVLAAEVMLVHLLFASSVTARKKRELVQTTLEGSGWSLPEDNLAVRALQQDIGSPGIGFNIGRYLQVGYLIDFALRFKNVPPEEQQLLLDDPWALRDFMDSTQLPRREMRHILLYLLRPTEFERIASGSQKKAIAAAFSSLLPDGGPEDTDEQLFSIRTALAELRGTDEFDFYSPDLRNIWDSGAASSSEGVGDLETLKWKKQIVLYGPPGTGKTFQARILAETLIRRAALEKWGPKAFFERSDEVDEAISQNVSWLQLHPSYGYDQFIRGLRLEGEVTRYRPGYLPNMVDRLNEQDPERRLPGVLVLDEINRTNLSEMLGEAFSLLESGQRGQARELPGFDHGQDPDVLVIPEDLYVIGTMNEIDQSVETLDFALRRRFLWRECPFESDALLGIIRSRWTSEVKRFSCEDATVQLEEFADHAQQLNDAIAESPELGRQFQIGHTYFADIVFFIGQWTTGMKNRPQNGTYLWTGSRKPRPPLVDLWNRSLKPLIEQYLAGSDIREDELARYAQVFLS